MTRKEKSNGQFGRTFFHPPSTDITNFNTTGPTLIDPNTQYLPNKFSTTAAQSNMSQVYSNAKHHHRAGTQMDLVDNKVNLLSSEPSLVQSQQNPQYMR